ncbi:MAG: pyridoxal phosphate-dependent aminotransferase [Bacilli bacterium]
MLRSTLIEQLPKQFFANLVAKVNAASAEGRDLINLGQGNPDQPTPAHIVTALQSAAENPINHRYSPFRGLNALKEAAAAFYRAEYNVEIDPYTEVAILFGGKIGLVEAPLAFCEPGNTVLVPDPGYPDYMSGIVLSQTTPVMMPLKRENDWLPKWRDYSNETLDAAKLMYLNYPNNPTGATATSSFFEETVAVASKHNIGVIHDFAYGALGFENKPVSFLQTPGAKDVGVEMYTFSKTYNMAGWRIGFAVGNKDMIASLELLQDHLYVSIFPAVQHAAIAALDSSQQCVAELNDLYTSRRTALIAACASVGWDVDAPSGSFFAWLKVPNGFTSQSFADHCLNNADVVFAPGNGFGECGEGYVRCGLLASPERITEAIQRIAKVTSF